MSTNRTRLRSTLPALVALVGLAAAAGVSNAQAVGRAPTAATTDSAACALPVFGPGADYQPTIRPADFGPDVTNPYFPLIVGKTYVYTGVKDGKTVARHRRGQPANPGHRRRADQGGRGPALPGRGPGGAHRRLLRPGPLRQRLVLRGGHGELDRRGRVSSTEGSFHAGVDGAEPGSSCRPTRARPAGSGRSGSPVRPRTLPGGRPSAAGQRAVRDVPLGAAHRGKDRARARRRSTPSTTSEESARCSKDRAGPREILRLVEIIS